MHERTDDASLADEDLVWRRILDTPNPWFAYKDGVLVASSAAFKDSAGEVSVNVAKETTLEDITSNHPEEGVVSLSVGIPRSLDHIVAKTLQADDPPEPSHRVICPPSSLGPSGRMKAARKMARASVWVILPASEREK